MPFGHAHRPVASRPRASTIPNLECLALRTGDRPLGTPNVDHGRVRAEDDARHRAIARDSLHRLGRDRQRELHVGCGRARQSEQSLHRCRDLKVRALRHETVVESPHAYVDQSIGLPPLQITVVVLSRALRQRLQCRPHRCTTDLVENALNQDDPVVGGCEGEASRLNALDFLGNETLGIASMPSVSAGVAESEHAHLAGLPKQLGLVEAIAEGSGSPRDQCEVAEPDLAGLHSGGALAEAVELLSDADPIAGGAATHMAVRLDPRDRTVEALFFVLVGLGISGGKDRELELVLIDLLSPADQLSSDLLAGPGCNSPHPTLHTKIVRTDVWRVKKKLVLISSPRTPAVLWPAGRTPTPSSQSVRPLGPTTGARRRTP